MKIRPVGAELFHADGRADLTQLIGAFRNFANAPKNCLPNESKLLNKFANMTFGSNYNLVHSNGAVISYCAFQALAHKQNYRTQTPRV